MISWPSSLESFLLDHFALCSCTFAGCTGCYFQLLSVVTLRQLEHVSNINLMSAKWVNWSLQPLQSFPGKAAVVSVLSLDTNLRSLLPFVESTGKCITLSAAWVESCCVYRLADWLIKIWLSFNSLLYVGVFWCSMLWCSLFSSITHAHVLHVTFTLLYEMFKEWYFLLPVHVVLPVFFLGTHHFKLCDYANLCVSQTSLVLVYFAFWLGDAKDDAKLKKCVSTRYATVLILLTVKCEYY